MSESPAGLSRRTLAKGAAWAAPAVAVAAAAPAHAASGLTTTLPPCVSDIAAVGGTYPVTYALSGCQTADSHWDFQFRITAATQDGTDCTCPFLRVTLFDNPKRTRLWITNPGGGILNPSTNTNNSPRLYVTKVLAAGTSANFPSQGDIVRRVLDSPYTGYNTGNGTQGTTVGTIEGFGDSNDTLHVLMTPTGGLPCNSSGPMAYYKVECGQTRNGPWTQLGQIGQIDPCTPMIQVESVCVTNTTNNDLYRLGISVLKTCPGLAASAFRITDIRRNSNTNALPGPTSAVWTGNVSLNDGVTYITTTNSSISGNQLWVTFTTDGVNFSQIRVPTNNTTCPGGCSSPPGIPVGRTACRVSGNSNSNAIHRYSWDTVTGATSYDVRYSTNTSNTSPGWTTVTGVTSPYTTTVAGVRRLQVRAVNACGTSNWSDSTNVSVNTGACGRGFSAGSEEGTAESLTTQSGTESTESTPPETTESSTTETAEPAPSETAAPTDQ